MPLLLVLLVGGALEITVLIWLGQAIGALPTLGLLLVGAVVGGWLLRREGRRTLREITDAVRARRAPTREFADGALIATGGLLIVLPGLLSDLAGLLCLLPPTRALLRRRLERVGERRSRVMGERMRTHVRFGYAAPAAGQAGGRPGSAEDVIDGEVVSVNEEDERANPPRVDPPRSDGRADR